MRDLWEFEYTKGVTRIRESMNDRQHNGQKKSTKGQTTIYKIQLRKHRATLIPLKTEVNSGTSEGYAVPAPLVAPVVFPFKCVLR